ncbi:hypothetical protein [Jannaschia formosa]|uniref:hypothetical protein n=1 Tax=Jannaschia formosa TaxID=2259592 RepID=UPI001431A0A8|nr:hypothetical protein [Jannaschia formosa]
MARWRALLALCAALGAPAAAEPLSPAKIAQHRCAPLAERLALAPPSKPGPAKTPAQRARAAAAAEVAVWDLPRSRLVWNFDCADRPNGAASQLLEMPADATMLAAGAVLSVAGEIDIRFAERLEAKLDANPQVTTVALVSPGGSVGAAIAAGALLRRRGLATEAAGACVSACPFVFLGGRIRRLTPGVGRLGFHQAAWANGTAVSAIDPIQVRMGAHVSRMGAAPLAVLGWMRQAAPDDMLYPARREICAAGLATRPTCAGVPEARP